MTLSRYIARLFRHRPIVVQTYKVKKTKAEIKRDEIHRQLAREVGWCWPVYRKEDELGLVRALEQEFARDPAFSDHGVAWRSLGRLL